MNKFGSMTFRIAAIGFGLVSAGSVARADSLLVNGNFETGAVDVNDTIPDWTVVTGSGSKADHISLKGVPDGTNASYTSGTTAADGGKLVQFQNTMTNAGGEIYQVFSADADTNYVVGFSAGESDDNTGPILASDYKYVDAYIYAGANEAGTPVAEDLLAQGSPGGALNNYTFDFNSGSATEFTVVFVDDAVNNSTPSGFHLTLDNAYVSAATPLPTASLAGSVLLGLVALPMARKRLVCGA